jgi:hypothetical protein
MSDALNLAEIDGQHAELLPPRTVLSVFSLYGGSSGGPGRSGGGNTLRSIVNLLGLFGVMSML